MVLNSLSICLSVKLSISLSYLNETLAWYSNLGCRFFSFITLSMSCHSLLSWRVSIERSAVILMGIPLCLICCFSFAAFNIRSLCLIFVNLINISWGISPCVYPVWDSLGFLDLGEYFLPDFREVFNYYFLKNFLMDFLVVFFWDSYDSNVGAFNIAPGVSAVALISFNSFFPLCFIYFHHSIFHLTCPIFCLSYSTVGSRQSAFDLSYFIICYWLTLFYFF